MQHEVATRWISFPTRRSTVAGLLLAAAFGAADPTAAQSLKGGTLRVAVLQDVVNFDPLQYSSVNYPLIRNLYDPLLEYTPDGKAVPGLAESWQIAPDNGSITLKLRADVADIQSAATRALPWPTCRIIAA